MIRWSGMLACLMGAAGVALAALGAHGGYPRADTAARMLLVTAPAVLALLALGRNGDLSVRIGRIGIALLLAGAILFSGDLVLRDLGWRVLPGFVAPLGGMLMVAGWLFAAAAAGTARRR
jgi:uncharacterized membrane protein YgdD (TMEM256/DUF423 family)